MMELSGSGGPATYVILTSDDNPESSAKTVASAGFVGAVRAMVATPLALVLTLALLRSPGKVPAVVENFTETPLIGWLRVFNTVALIWVAVAPSATMLPALDPELRSNRSDFSIDIGGVLSPRIVAWAQRPVAHRITPASAPAAGQGQGEECQKNKDQVTAFSHVRPPEKWQIPNQPIYS